MLADVIATVIYYIHFYAILTIYGQESTPILWEPIVVLYIVKWRAEWRKSTSDKGRKILLTNDKTRKSYGLATKKS